MHLVGAHSLIGEVQHPGTYSLALAACNSSKPQPALPDTANQLFASLSSHTPNAGAHSPCIVTSKAAVYKLDVDAMTMLGLVAGSGLSYEQQRELERAQLWRTSINKQVWPMGRSIDSGG